MTRSRPEDRAALAAWDRAVLTDRKLAEAIERQSRFGESESVWYYRDSVARYDARRHFEKTPYAVAHGR